MPNYVYTEFSRNAVEPVACIKAGWRLIKDRYWLFVGMSVVTILAGNAVPLGILMGPMMCGIFLSLFQRMRGEPVEFGTLFKGFDYFGQSVLATLIHVIPVVVVLAPFYLFLFVAGILSVPDSRSGRSASPGVFFGMMALLLLVMFLVLMIVSILFMFAYPLIVDRKLSGVDAVKLSCKAGLGNFWRLLGLFLLNALMAIGGVLLCYVGAFLVMPIGFAALANAYQQVFGMAPGRSPYPPPPPAFN